MLRVAHLAAAFPVCRLSGNERCVEMLAFNLKLPFHTAVYGCVSVAPCHIYVFFHFPAGMIAHSQRNYAATPIWNEPLPLTLVGTPADPNHSSNLPTAMDPLMFLAGAVPSCLNAYPAAAAAASAIMPPASDLILGPVGVSVGEEGDGGGGGLTGAGLGGTAANINAAVAGGGVSSQTSRANVVSNSVDRDYETSASAKPSLLRLLQTQNAHLVKVARTLSHTAHSLEVCMCVYARMYPNPDQYLKSCMCRL